MLHLLINTTSCILRMYCNSSYKGNWPSGYLYFFKQENLMKRINKIKQPRDVVAYFLLPISWFAFQSIAALAADELHDDLQITYAGDVAAIINENCVVCHREGGIGPMELTSYENVRPWAPLIQLRVANREMPPYAYDHDIGNQNLQGDWRLSQDDIDTVVALSLIHI